MTNDIYTAITFAPVQGFIEKSRKLRDLYGASLILSYLSQQIVQAGHKPPETKVISPGSINIQRGMPNRILIKGDFSREKARSILLTAWKDILCACKDWIEQYLSEFDYYWEKDWLRWSNNTWEVFWGTQSMKAYLTTLSTLTGGQCDFLKGSAIANINTESVLPRWGKDEF